MQLIKFIIPVFLVIFLVSVLSRPAPEPTDFNIVQPSKHCSLPPIYRIGYQRDEASIIRQGEGFRFQGVSWLETDICTPGNLLIKADGERANGQDPILIINLNSQSLDNINIPAKQINISINIPKPGRLILAYLNDYYLADARVAKLENFNFLSPTCQTFEVNVPKETGGTWLPAYKSVSLVSNVPITVIPCSAGELTLQISGQAGLKTFPTLTFQQDNKILNTIITTQNRQTLKINLSTSPLTITLINPYARALADRNLNIRNLTFIPDQPKSP